jgi:hypothetical protein
VGLEQRRGILRARCRAGRGVGLQVIVDPAGENGGFHRQNRSFVGFSCSAKSGSIGRTDYRLRDRVAVDENTAENGAPRQHYHVHIICSYIGDPRKHRQKRATDHLFEWNWKRWKESLLSNGSIEASQASDSGWLVLMEVTESLPCYKLACRDV